MNAAESASLYLIRLPTISVGYTMSSRIASWTAVNVLVLGRGPFCAVDLLIDFDRIVRCATITTCLPLNFFSSSRTSLVCTLWKSFNKRYGTKMIIALRPPSSSSSLAALMYKSCRSAFISLAVALIIIMLILLLII